MESTILENGVKVSLIPEGSDLERMLSVVKSDDFLQETDLMLEQKGNPPYTIMLYDDLIGLGTYTTDDNVGVGIKPYSDLALNEWVDIALSTFQHSVKIRDKTTDGSAAEKLKFRTDLDWIDFDGDYISENTEKQCDAMTQMWNETYSKDLYSLMERKGKTFVSYYRINDEYAGLNPVGEYIDGIRAEFQDREIWDIRIDDAEAVLRKAHPTAAVVKQPLWGCEYAVPPVNHVCLPTLFEQVYADKYKTNEQAKLN